MRSKPTLSRSHDLNERSGQTLPQQVLWGLWGTLLFLTLLTADELRARVARDSFLGSQEWALALSAGFARSASALGLTQLYGELRGFATAAVPEPPRPGISALASVRDVTAEPDLGAASAAGAREGRGATRAGAGIGRRRFDLGHVQVRKVLLVGASSIQFYLGAELERLLVSNYDGVEVLRRGKVSTGLARPDLLDWPRELARSMGEYHPDLVVSDFGGNDAQNMVLESGKVLKFGTRAWDDEYRARVSRVIEIAHQGGARIALLGMPSARSASFSRRMRQLNELIANAAAQRGAVFVPTWDLSADAYGRYRESVTVDGVRGLMRLADGKHYSRLGAVAVTRKLVVRLEESFTLVNKDRARSAVVRRDVASKALGRKVPYVAYVPQAAARGGQRLPVLYLLHGADAGFADWPQRAHRVLQRLSNEHGVMIVIPDGARDGWYVDSPLIPTHRHATWVVDELLPDVDAWLPSNGRRGIAGQSAGGHGALTLALTHPGLFLSASSMSGVLDLPAARNRPALIRALGQYSDDPEAWHRRSARHIVARKPKPARRLPMLISVGSADRWVLVNRTFARELEALHIPHQFQESAGGHDWNYWVSELPLQVAWHASLLKSPPAGTAGASAGVIPPRSEH